MENKPKFNYHYGDILDYIISDEPTFVLHGCNCMCTMGAGIAGRLARLINVTHADNTYGGLQGRHTPYHQALKLGNISIAQVTLDTTVINGYTQFTPGPCFQMNAFELVMFKTISLIQRRDAETDTETSTLVMPRIGCGIATPKGMDKRVQWVLVQLSILRICKEMKFDINRITIIGMPGDELIYEKPIKTP